MHALDHRFIHFCKRISLPFARVAIFIVFFWFGLLKVINMSPASPLVHTLFDKTMFLPISFPVFFLLFGLLEMLIGVLFLIRGAERIAIIILFLHMITTAMPLFLLPHMVWVGFLAPTLEGQYIIKNVLIVALAIVIGSNLHPRDSMSVNK